MTLMAEESMLSSMFSGQHKFEVDKDGCPFIDRPGDHFGHIINYLRDRSLMPPSDIAMQVCNDHWEDYNDNDCESNHSRSNCDDDVLSLGTIRDVQRYFRDI